MLIKLLKFLLVFLNKMAQLSSAYTFVHNKDEEEKRLLMNEWMRRDGERQKEKQLDR